MSRTAVLSVVMIVLALGTPRAATTQASPGTAMSAAALLTPASAQPFFLGSVGRDEARLADGREPFVELPQVRNRRGIPWMITGGALFLAGAIIGDDGGTLLVLGGVGAAAYGAYVYFGD
jgi:hypothetical protein